MKLGLTLFSLINEWQTGDYSLAALLERVASTGIGPTVEVVGGQSFRNFPAVAAEDVRQFRGTMERLELEPTALGVFADLARFPERMLTTEEIVADLEQQVDAASELGFPIVRAGLGLEPSVLRSLVPHLENRDVILTLEVQGSTTPDSPALVRTLDTFDSLDSPHLGLTLDFSLFMPDIPLTLVAHLADSGVRSATIAALRATWRGENDGWPDLVRIAQADGTPAEIIEQCRAWLFRFGRTPAGQWRHLLPWVHHVHAKFWDLERPQSDVVEPHRAFLQLLAEGGYQKAIASEWGGSDWLDLDDVDSFEMTAAHLDLVADILTDLGVNS